MTPSVEDTIRQIKAGQVCTLRQPWYAPFGYLALAVALGGGGYFAVRLGFTLGWLFLIFGGIGLLTGVVGLCRPKPALQLDRTGLTILPKNVQHPWPDVSHFFVSTGEIGDQWVSFRTKSGDADSSQDPSANRDLNSNFGFQPKQLADFLNALRAALTD